METLSESEGHGAAERRGDDCDGVTAVERSFGDALYLLLVAMALEKSVNLVVLVEDRASELADFVDNLRSD